VQELAGGAYVSVAKAILGDHLDEQVLRLGTSLSPLRDALAAMRLCGKSAN